MTVLKKGSKKLLNAWAFYDWANSVYTLTIASAIFPIFYSSLFFNDVKTIHVFGLDLKSTALISFVTAFTFFVITFLSPILSGVADYIGNKKMFLKFFCYTGSIGCIGLYWFSLEHIYISLLFYFFGLIGYWGSLVFYNSYLPDIAFPKQQDALSAKGFSIGYVGSVILLLFNLAMVLNPSWFGIEGTEKEASEIAMRYSFVTVGLWWAIFSQYTFYYLPKGISMSPAPPVSIGTFSPFGRVASPLGKFNIEVIRGCTGNTKKIVTNFLKGEILDNGITCSHNHEHEHNHQCNH